MSCKSIERDSSPGLLDPILYQLKAVNRFTFGFSTQVSTIFPFTNRTCPWY